jgi:hypothetical protein
LSTVFGIKESLLLPEFGKTGSRGQHKRLKLSMFKNGDAIAIERVPVIIGCWNKLRAAKKSRDPARASAKKRPLQREIPAGGFCGRHGGKTTGHTFKLGGQ